ncbi:type II secretion system protein E [bacterium BMS3Abin15]|nr:type II secretion system protein E [bacterium BMS3Abin15]HDZ85331.1 type II/IV secretion system protein [Candidatus Moranbacteria bacterium]
MVVNSGDGKKNLTADNQKRTKNEKNSDIPHLSKVPKKISRRVLNIISEDAAKRHQMAVFERKGSSIRVAMVDPQDIEALNMLRFIAEKEKFEVEIFLVSPQIFQEIIENYATAEKAVEEVIESFKGEEIKGLDVEKREEKKDRVRESIQDAPVAKLVQVIIRHAIDGRASDAHIEPIEDNFRVRFRVDGILHSSLILPKEVGRAVVSRIKILSNLKIDEKRKPQDGRFKIEDGGQIVDFRVSTLPVIEGEKIAMRVLVKDDNLSNLKSLGLVGRNYEILNKRIRDPYGIILLTGPTGSGKSTTLYGFLQILNKEERNIVTLEDPVEYFIEGVNQSQIKPEIGYTFANGLRSILRQDPNIIMVGEIRDSETAELTIHAALTGHLVFSTLHTNDAIGAIPRMIDMNVEPFLLTSSLRVVAAQRLVRKICEKCKEEIKVPELARKKVEEDLRNIPPEEVKRYGVDLSQGMKFFRGKGCESCGNVGFRGRIAIFEVVEINEKIQELISESENSELEVRKEAENQGMITMRQDGFFKVLNGITTLSEVTRTTEGILKSEEQLE